MRTDRLAAWKRMSKHSDEQVRCKAALKRPKVEFRKVAPTFARLLADESDLVRAEAADSLGYYPCNAAKRMLEERLKTETSEFVQVYIAESLTIMGDVASLPSLWRLRDTNKLELRIETNLAIATILMSQTWTDLRKSASAENSSGPFPSTVMPRLETGVRTILQQIQGIVSELLVIARKSRFETERTRAKFIAENFRDMARDLSR